MGVQPGQEEPKGNGTEATVREEPQKVELTECKRCGHKADNEANYCPKCGDDLGRRTAKEMLGIELTNEDLDEYIFKGFLLKTVKCLGKNMTMRSSLADDHRKINDFLMKEWGEKQVTQEFWENLKGTAAIALAIEAFDGKPIGDSVKDRVAWLLERGSAMTDLVTTKVVLYNRALTDWIQDKDLFLAS